MEKIYPGDKVSLAVRGGSLIQAKFLKPSDRIFSSKILVVDTSADNVRYIIEFPIGVGLRKTRFTDNESWNLPWTSEIEFADGYPNAFGFVTLIHMFYKEDEFILSVERKETIVNSNIVISCKSCQTPTPYAASNQPDGSFKCYSCRI